MSTNSDKCKPRVAVAGAGPAGSSIAIRLALSGFDVTLVEREKFPRHKLCGEFISPECLRHFAELGVLDEMLAAGGQRIFETRFYDRRGRGFSVPSSLLDDGGFALSLSRSSMDDHLMERARSAGVQVMDGTRVTEVHIKDGIISALVALDESGAKRSVEGDLFIDAAGRGSAISRLAGRATATGAKPETRGSLAVGFKNHLKGVRLSPGICEIYSFPGGYGGLTGVEGGLANLCFLMDPRAARKIGSAAGELVRKAVCMNDRAVSTLAEAEPVNDWLAVSIGSFGRSASPPAGNLFAIGDSAAFIDPFTGSGMLMALESSALLAEAVCRNPRFPAAIRGEYTAAYDLTFTRRLRICSLLRQTAFMPILPTLAIAFLRLSRRGRNYIAAGTRTSRVEDQKIG